MDIEDEVNVKMGIKDEANVTMGIKDDANVTKDIEDEAKVTMDIEDEANVTTDFEDIEDYNETNNNTKVNRQVLKPNVVNIDFDEAQHYLPPLNNSGVNRSPHDDYLEQYRWFQGDMITPEVAKCIMLEKGIQTGTFVVLKANPINMLAYRLIVKNQLFIQDFPVLKMQDSMWQMRCPWGDKIFRNIPSLVNHFIYKSLPVAGINEPSTNHKQCLYDASEELRHFVLKQSLRYIRRINRSSRDRDVLEHRGRRHG